MFSVKKYRSKLLILLLVFGLNTSLFAQISELSASAGFMFNGKISYYEGEANVFNNVSYGGIFGVAITSRIKIETIYNRCDTKVEFLEYNYLNKGTYKMLVENFHVGAMLELAYGNVKPYVALSLGATRFHLKDISEADSWRFSVAPAFGTKFFFNDIVGMRLQARLILPMEFSDAQIFINSEEDKEIRNFRIPIVQADITAGIFVVLK